MKEEEKIIQKCGKKNPFEVPQGYFEGFTQQLMEKLPEQPTDTVGEQTEYTITPWQRIKPLLYLAAMFVGLTVCVRGIFPEQPNEEKASTESLSVSNEEEMDAVVEYAMLEMDNYTIYQYLTETE